MCRFHTAVLRFSSFLYIVCFFVYIFVTSCSLHEVALINKFYLTFFLKKRLVVGLEVGVVSVWPVSDFKIIILNAKFLKCDTYQKK